MLYDSQWVTPPDLWFCVTGGPAAQSDQREALSTKLFTQYKDVLIQRVHTDFPHVLLITSVFKFMHMKLSCSFLKVS